MIEKKLEEKVIEVALKIAKRHEGALFVLGDTNYEVLVDQQIKNVNIFENSKLVESLALMDGAVILDKKGKVKAYGALIKQTYAYRNYGTRHAAALKASLDATCVLVSEEEQTIKIFKNGKIMMQIDALQRNVEKTVPHAVNILESIGAGTLGTIGTTIFAPMVGIALLPGIIVFSSVYYLGKELMTYGRRKYVN